MSSSARYKVVILFDMVVLTRTALTEGTNEADRKENSDKNWQPEVEFNTFHHDTKRLSLVSC